MVTGRDFGATQRRFSVSDGGGQGSAGPPDQSEAMQPQTHRAVSEVTLILMKDQSPCFDLIKFEDNVLPDVRHLSVVMMSRLSVPPNLDSVSLRTPTPQTPAGPKTVGVRLRYKSSKIHEEKTVSWFNIRSGSWSFS